MNRWKRLTFPVGVCKITYKYNYVNYNGGNEMDYKNAGVDIEAGYKSVELMKRHVQATMRPEVLTNIGGFSGASRWKNLRTWKNRHSYLVQTE